MAVGALGAGCLRSDPWMPIAFFGFVGLGAMVYAAGPGLLMILSPPAVRGVTTGMMGTIAGVIVSAFAQFVGLLLNKQVRRTVHGRAIYTGSGMAMVFLITAAMCLVAILIRDPDCFGTVDGNQPCGG